MHIKKTSVRTEFFYYLSWFSEQRTLDAFIGHKREVLMNRRQENLLWVFVFLRYLILSTSSQQNISQFNIDSISRSQASDKTHPRPGSYNMEYETTSTCDFPTFHLQPLVALRRGYAGRRDPQGDRIPPGTCALPELEYPPVSVSGRRTSCPCSQSCSSSGSRAAGKRRSGWSPVWSYST